MWRASVPQPKPASATVTRLKPQFAADVVHLGDLRLLQRDVGRRKIGAGVDELRIEPESIEIPRQVVMMMDILARALRRIRSHALHPARSGSRVPMLARCHRDRAIHGLE